MEMKPAWFSRITQGNDLNHGSFIVVEGKFRQMKKRCLKKQKKPYLCPS